ncbi:transferase family protein [Salix suchowensis]|nr:transferase family protein [Salix suchowensis]
MPSSSNTTVISRCTIYPPGQESSTIKTLKLSVSDLPMLSCQYIQKGVLLTYPPYSINDLIKLLKHSLSAALSHFPALAGRLQTDPTGHVHIVCNDAGVDFIQAKARHLSIHAILSPTHVPECFKGFFAMDKTLSYSGHSKPLMAVQVTELKDGIFIGCAVNHAVTDGTSFWNFFNTFAETCKGSKKISKSPDFSRNTMFNSPVATFSGDEPLRERIFHFSRDAILKLKLRANSSNFMSNSAEIFGKQSNDSWKIVNGESNGNNGLGNGKVAPLFSESGKTAEISSFQSLCAQLWISVTRARKLSPSKMTTFRMAVNCRHRLEPRLDPYYFGNAIQSIPTVALAGKLLSNDLSFGADLLHKNVVSHGDDTVRKGIADWEREPRLFPLGNFDGASITMGSSPRFPMYDNDFGWGRPVAVRSGGANKFDGKISAFPGRDGNGSVDLEVVLSPDTMIGLENDDEFMQYVSGIV